MCDGEGDPHLSTHGGEVPHAADDGPAAHHVEEVVHHAKRTAVPERISEPRGILKTHTHTHTHTKTDKLKTHKE